MDQMVIIKNEITLGWIISLSSMVIYLIVLMKYRNSKKQIMKTVNIVVAFLSFCIILFEKINEMYEIANIPNRNDIIFEWSLLIACLIMINSYFDS